MDSGQPRQRRFAAVAEWRHEAVGLREYGDGRGAGHRCRRRVRAVGLAVALSAPHPPPRAARRRVLVLPAHVRERVQRPRHGPLVDRLPPGRHQLHDPAVGDVDGPAVHFDDDDEPIHWVVPVTNDALFGCPFIIASAVGSMVLSQDDADRLRDYLLKGGFLWVDDFWGSWEWEPVGEPDHQGASARRVSHRRPPHRASPVPDDVLHLGGPPDRQHRLLAALGRAHVGTRLRQRRAPLPRDLRRAPAASWSR